MFPFLWHRLHGRSKPLEGENLSCICAKGTEDELFWVKLRETASTGNIMSQTHTLHNFSPDKRKWKSIPRLWNTISIRNGVQKSPQINQAPSDDHYLPSIAFPLNQDIRLSCSSSPIKVGRYDVLKIRLRRRIYDISLAKGLPGGFFDTPMSKRSPKPLRITFNLIYAWSTIWEWSCSKWHWFRFNFMPSTECSNWWPQTRTAVQCSHHFESANRGKFTTSSHFSRRHRLQTAHAVQISRPSQNHVEIRLRTGPP